MISLPNKNTDSQDVNSEYSKDYYIQVQYVKLIYQIMLSGMGNTKVEKKYMDKVA